MPSLSPQATELTLTIGGVDVTEQLRRGSVRINMRLNLRWDASFDLYDEDGSLSIQVGQNVLIEEGDGRAFLGKLDDIERVRAVDNAIGSQLFYRCKCVDLMARLDQRVCSEWSVHKGVNAADVVYFALANFAWGDDINFDLVASPGGFIEGGAYVEKFVFNKQTVLEVIEAMCKLSDTVAFVDVNGDFHFEDIGSSDTEAPFSISATSANFTRISVRRSKTEGAGASGSGYFNQSWTRTSWAAWEQRHNTFTRGRTDPAPTGWILFDPDNPGTPMAAAIVVDIKLNGKSVDFGGENEGRAYTWYYGESRIVPGPGEPEFGVLDTLEVWFHSMDQGYIFAQDLTEITARGAIEGNTGQCARIFDDSQETNFAAATDKAEAALNLAKTMPDIVTLEANGYGPNPIFPRPGMVFSIDLDYPSIHGDFSIQEVSAQEIAGAGLKYVCKCVTKASSRRLANGVDYFRELARKKPGTTISGGAGDGGPKSGPIPYRALINDATVGNDVAPVVSVYGVVIQQVSRIRRIQATPRISLDADMTARFKVRYPDGTDHTIGSFTLPASTPAWKSVEFLPAEFDWDTLPDKSTLRVDITASGGEVDKDGVATWLIETIGRGGELPTAEGVGWEGEWADVSPAAVYQKDSVVFFDGSAWISTINDNDGQPGVDPGWDLIVSKGDTGATGPGVPTGGTTGQQLVKASGTDYDTAWVDRVSSVAGRTGAVTLAESDVSGLVSDLAAKLDDSQLDTDGTLAANSATRIPAQSAVKTYVDARAPESVQLAGTLIGTRQKLNFIAGLGISLSISDDAANGRVNITINASGGGGSVVSGAPVWSSVESPGNSTVW